MSTPDKVKDNPCKHYTLSKGNQRICGTCNARLRHSTVFPGKLRKIPYTAKNIEKVYTPEKVKDSSCKPYTLSKGN